MRVVVLGVDSPIGLALVRDLGLHGYAVTALGRQPGALGLKSKYCAQAVIRAQDGEALIAQLLALVDDAPDAALLAVGEADIALLNRYRAELATRYHLLFPDDAQMAKVLDKSVTQDYAARVGIETPRSWQLQDWSQLDALLEGMSFPVILKWANPHEVSQALRQAGLRLHKIEYCQSPEALRQCLQPYRVIAQYPLIQQYYAGHGLGQFFLCRDGEALMQFQHERVHEWPPEGGSACLCRSVDNALHADCAERSRALLKALNWQGVAMVEYRYDPGRQRYVLMEINGRFWGSTPLSLVAGAGFATPLVQALAQQQPLAPRRIRSRYCRYMIPECKRLWRILFRPQQIRDPACRFNRLAELLAFFAYFLHPRCRYYVFWLSDPKPFFADMGQALAKVGRRSLSLLGLQKRRHQG